MSNPSGGDRTASPFQPSLTTHALARIDWTQRIGAGSWDKEEAIDGFLAENASVPPLVREARLHQEKLDLYAGKSTSDVRMRLLGRVYVDDRTFKKSALLRMLQDPNARGVIALDFTKAKDFRIFLNEGRNSVLGPIKALTLGFAPKPEDIEALFSRLRSCVALRFNVYRQSEPFDERLADALIEAGCVPNLMSGDAGDMHWSESALERLSAADFDLKRARARFGDQHGFFFVT